MNGVRHVEPRDIPAIAAIYNHYIRNTVVTFEMDEVSDAEMQQRIINTTQKFPWLVLEVDEQIVGYAYATTWRTRVAYNKTCETTVYLHPEAGGHGYGTALYEELLIILKEQQYHRIIGGVTMPNDASVALHEKMGYVKTGEFTEVGRKFDQWLNVGFWTLEL